MSDQPPTSHELFHDVTDSRPRGGRAAGGTLAVSIVAHALILAAVIVVPLLATDALPDVVDTIRFRVEPLPPPEPPPLAITRTPSTAKPTQRNPWPVEPPDEIVDERPPVPPVECANCVVDPKAVIAVFGRDGGTGPAVPQPHRRPRAAEAAARGRAEHADEVRRGADLSHHRPSSWRRGHGDHRGGHRGRRHGPRRARVRSVTLLDHAALDAVKWRYAPTRSTASRSR